MSMPRTTDAQAIESFGGPEVLRRVSLPLAAPGAGEVQIKVAAAAVNPVDLQTRTGYVLAAEVTSFPMVLGWDAAGSIEAIGDGVTGWELGDRIAAMSFQPIDQNGTYAHHVNLAADLLARVPDGLSLEHAASIPLAGLTASQLLRWVDLTAAKTLLVNGPMGAVGRFVVQLASGAGIRVLAVVKPEDRDGAIKLGATETVDRGDFAAAVRSLHAGGTDAAIDLVGRAAAHSALASVRDGGAFATTFNDYENPGCELRSERGILVEQLTVHPDATMLSSLLEAAAHGALTTEIERTYPLAQAAEAHRRQDRGGLHGKLLLIP